MAGINRQVILGQFLHFTYGQFFPSIKFFKSKKPLRYYDFTQVRVCFRKIKCLGSNALEKFFLNLKQKYAKQFLMKGIQL